MGNTVWTVALAIHVTSPPLSRKDLQLYSCTYLVLHIKSDVFPVCHLVCVFVRVALLLCLWLDLSCTTSTPFGTVDQAISCSKTKILPDAAWERECCIIFKSQPLGSVKTSDEYREACGGVYVHMVVFVWTILPQCCLCVRLKGLYQCVSAGLLSWPPGASGTTDSRAKFTSVKVIYMKQVLDT